MILKKVSLAGRICALLLMTVSWVVAGEVIVSWSPNVEKDLMGYRIYYGTNGGDYTNFMDVGNVTNRTVNNLMPGTTYFFAVTAYDSAGNESEYSKEVGIELPPLDNSKPEIVGVNIIDNKNIDLMFSESIEEIFAENKSNYTINNGIQIISVTLGPDLQTVHIHTSDHQPGIYTIRVNNIKDRATPPNTIIPNSEIAYEILDQQPPSISGIEIVDQNTIQLSFNEEVDKASAEHEPNYQLSQNMQVFESELDANEKTVVLTTSDHAEGNYQLVVNNIKDKADPPNIIMENTVVNYSYFDTISPLIAEVAVLSDTTLELAYSEPVEKNSAENTQNYQISGSLNIRSITLESNHKTVRVLTDPHLEGNYTITVNNIKDRAQNPNTIAANSTISYEYIDTIVPSIKNVFALNDTSINIKFSEPIAENTGEMISNYSVNKGIQVLSAALMNDLVRVNLVTTKHEEDVYTVTIQNIKDRANQPNIIPSNSTFEYRYVDSTPPQILSLNVISDNQLKIKMSEKVQQASAENVNNYDIDNGVTVNRATLSEDERTVTLVTTLHDENSYSLTVKNLKDKAQAPNILKSQILQYQYIDTVPPSIAHVEAIGENQVDVTFSEKVEEETAENSAHYSINKNIIVEQAYLDNNLKTVHLQTSTHQEDTYTISVSGIKDRANSPNVVIAGSNATYQYIDVTPPAIINVQAETDTLIKVSFTEPMTASEAQNKANYSIEGGVSVLQATFTDSNHIVYLKTTSHAEGNYRLLVRNLKDRANQPNVIAEGSNYEYVFVDQSPPQIINVRALIENHVTLFFNEPVEKSSAETKQNYHINNGIIIQSATLDADLKTVHLLTSKHNPGFYTISVSNVRDRSSQNNAIISNSQFDYEYIDKTPPSVVAVDAPVENQLDVRFSEPVEITSAENSMNYRIVPEIHIQSIQLSADNLVAHLETSAHRPGDYTLFVNNIRDQAVNPNKSDREIEFHYSYVDRTPPRITDVRALSEKKVQIRFSEVINKSSAELVANYTIEPEIVVNSASLADDSVTVVLDTEAHLPGGYTIYIRNIYDLAENPNVIDPNNYFSYQYLDQTPPVIVNVEALDETHVDVVFSEYIDQLSAEQITNYQINKGIDIYSSTLDANGITVHLVTSSHIPGQYELSVSHVLDRADPPNKIASNSKVNYEYIDRTPPQLTAVQAVDENHVDVYFSEPVETVSAETIANYSINGGVVVNSAQLDNDQTTVHLTTSPHIMGQYTITVSHVKDRAVNPNVIVAGSQKSYQYIDRTPPSIVSVQAFDKDSLEVVFSEPVEKRPAEELSNYRVDNNGSIITARLDQNKTSVFLTTTPQAEGDHTLYVKNISDVAETPNVMIGENSFAYSYYDVIPPHILSVTTDSANQVVVVFSEPINKMSAEDVANYAINRDINIMTAHLEKDDKTVTLFTSSHNEGNYNLTVNGVKDKALTPNTISNNSIFSYGYIDRYAPLVVQVTASKEDQLIVLFNEPVEKNLAENTSNYSINQRITAKSAQLADDFKTVQLQTSEHQEKLYQITINNIRDRASNPNTIKSNTQKDYRYVDQFPPEIIGLDVLSENELKITFSEPITRTTAENKANYTINEGITVLGAVLESDSLHVKLTTTSHEEKVYTLRVSQIRDCAKTPNVIAQNTQYQYEYIDRISPAITNVIAPAPNQVRIIFTEPVEKVSAETIANYSIMSDVSVIEATLSDDPKIVDLRTTAHEEGSYQLTVSKVKDMANSPNLIEDNSIFQYQFVDRRAPELVDVKAISDTSIDVYFSKPVEQASAEETANYQINKNIQVNSAHLSEDWMVVRLITTKHEEGAYSLSVSNIRDRANNPNTIEENSNYNYLYVDRTPPMIQHAQTLADTLVEVNYSEPVDPVSAQLVENYNILNGVEIKSAVLDQSHQRAMLKTSKHEEGLYTIEINNIKDQANNPNIITSTISAQYAYQDDVLPWIVAVRTSGPDQIDVIFSEKIDEQSACAIENYHISGNIVVSLAELDGNNKTVRLLTSTHQEGIYTLTVSNIKDRAQNPNTIAANSQYQYEYFDMIAPTVTRVKAEEKSIVKIYFSEPVDQSSAEHIGNYQINNGIIIESATLNHDNQTVNIRTSNHQSGNYIISVKNIVDKSRGKNQISPNSYFQYQYEDTEPPAILEIRMLDATHLDVVFSEKVEKNSAELPANYRIKVGDDIDDEAALQGLQDLSLEGKMKPILKKGQKPELNIQIISLKLDSNERIVHVRTTQHEPGKYEIIVNNILDQARNPNQIRTNQGYPYRFYDTIPPYITDVTIEAEDKVNVYFSEKMGRESAEASENYSLNNGVSVLSAVLDNSDSMVELTTTPHISGESYQLCVKNVTDQASKPNFINSNTVINYIYVDNSPDIPGTVYLHPIETGAGGELLINWEPASGNNILGYKIYYGTESGSYDTNLDVGNVVNYAIAGLIEGMQYFVVVTAYNNRGMESNFSNEQSAAVRVMDVTPPTIYAVSAKSDSEIVIVFSEKVEKLSAEETSNYKINNGIEIFDAVQDTNKRTLRLQTSKHAPGGYTLTISNVKDMAANPNKIKENSTYQYYYYPDDKEKPYVKKIDVPDRTHLKLTFNEMIERRSAEKISNYSINNNINIYQAILDSSGSIVTLITSDHLSGMSYELKLENIKDLALPANTIDSNTKLIYNYQNSDTDPPEIYAVQVRGEIAIDIIFSEMVDRSTAEDVNNYYINKGLTVLEASLDETQKIVHLKTSPHQPETIYTVTANNIFDRAYPPNAIKTNNSYRYMYLPDDVNPPILFEVVCNEGNKLDLVFSEFLDRISAENENNYKINKGVNVISAELTGDLKTVRLVTSQQVYGEEYLLTLNNIADISTNVNCVTNFQFNYLYIIEDCQPPEIEFCYLTDSTHLKIMFNEFVERSSAEKLTNYSITNGIQIFDAFLDSTLKSVILTTSEHNQNVGYTLTINNVRDRAKKSNKIIEANVDYQYRLNENEYITGLTPEEYQIGYLNVGDTYYIDRDFTISEVADEFDNSLWIRTAQKHADDQSAEFLKFNLLKKSDVYIGYDKHALNYPDWLIDNGYRIGETIRGNAENQIFDLWKFQADSGQIVLGGNQAQGAENANNMYLVVISNEDMKNRKVPNQMNDPDEPLVLNSFELYQNYPNPFNDVTQIKYYLTENAFVDIKIYNILGQTVRQVVNKFQEKGMHRMIWDAKNDRGISVGSGIYFVRMTVNQEQQQDGQTRKKMLYQKVRKLTLIR